MRYKMKGATGDGGMGEGGGADEEEEELDKPAA